MNSENFDERIDESIPIDDVKGWIRNCGYDGKIPSTKTDVWRLYNRLAKERKPTERQLDYLDSLGHKGAKPKTMYDASVLVDRRKQGIDTGSPLSPNEQRKEWVKERREEFKEYIEVDLESNKNDYQNLHSDDIRDYFRLVGWKLDFDEAGKCPRRRELKELIYLAQIQVSDIVDHLPPFDECPAGCEDCQLETVVLDDIPISGNQYNIRYVQWDSPKFRANVPKYIFKIFDNPPTFANVTSSPSIEKSIRRHQRRQRNKPTQSSAGQSSARIESPQPKVLTPEEEKMANRAFAGCAALILLVISAFFFGFWKTTEMFLLVIAATAGFIVVRRYWNTVKVFVSNNAPFILIGSVTAVVLLVLIWLIFSVL